MLGLLFILLTAGCAGIENAPSGEPPAATATRSEAVTVKPPRSAVTPGEAAAVKPPATAATPSEAVTVDPAMPSTTGTARQSVARADAPAAKTPARVPAFPAPAEQIAKKESAAPAAEKPAAPPPLDVTSLEKRLRETDAIGVFTKLTLKNQVDELLNRFRAYYEGRAKTTLAELRQPFDLLILKVLSLLQDGDPPLASAVRASREALWGILSDPVKFSKL